MAVLMIWTPSRFLGPPTRASAMSAEGRTWAPIPAGAVVTGSKFALVFRNLRWTEERMDLGAYEVGVGPKAGTPLVHYLRDRVDKACVRLAAVPGPAAMAAIVLRAELVPPYAVLLRVEATQDHRTTRAWT